MMHSSDRAHIIEQDISSRSLICLVFPLTGGQLSMQGEQQLQLFEMDQESIPGYIPGCNPISKGCAFC